jgi:hypothetical protein
MTIPLIQLMNITFRNGGGEMTKRYIDLVGTDLRLELSKATAVKTKQNMIHLDQLPVGTWRLIYNGDMIPDFSKIECLRIVRED